MSFFSDPLGSIADFVSGLFSGTPSDLTGSSLDPTALAQAGFDGVAGTATSPQIDLVGSIAGDAASGGSSLGLGSLPILTLLGGNAAGSILGANAATTAAELQNSAAMAALRQSQGQAGTLENNLTPYMNNGSSAAALLAQLTGIARGTNPLSAPLTKPFTPADLTNTPGYKFTLQQGLNATQNALAAQGLGRSGNALAGATQYAEGLAGTTFNQQLENYLAQNQQIYNMLLGNVQSGQNAAIGTGNIGVPIQGSVNNLLTGGASALGAGQVGQANAISGGVGNMGNLLMTAAFLNRMGQGGSMFGG